MKHGGELARLSLHERIRARQGDADRVVAWRQRVTADAVGRLVVDPVEECWTLRSCRLLWHANQEVLQGANLVILPNLGHHGWLGPVPERLKATCRFVR